MPMDIMAIITTNINLGISFKRFAGLCHILKKKVNVVTGSSADCLGTLDLNYFYKN